MHAASGLYVDILNFSKSTGGLAPIVQFLASSTKLSAWSSEALPPKVCRRGHSNKLFQGLVSLAKFPRPVKFCAAQESSIVEPVVTCPFRYTIKKLAFFSTQGSNPTHHPEELFVRRLTGANSCQGWRAARLPSTSACHPMKPGPRALRPTALPCRAYATRPTFASGLSQNIVGMLQPLVQLCQRASPRTGPMLWSSTRSGHPPPTWMTRRLSRRTQYQSVARGA